MDHADDNPLRARRAELKCTQFQMAIALGVTVQVIVAWENDLAVPRISRLKALCSAYGVSASVMKKWIVKLASRVAARRVAAAA